MNGIHVVHVHENTKHIFVLKLYTVHRTNKNNTVNCSCMSTGITKFKQDNKPAFIYNVV